jgi:hypothetical protein
MVVWVILQSGNNRFLEMRRKEKNLWIAN